MHINFIRQRCDLCGRYISRPNYSRHVKACERRSNQKKGLDNGA